MPVEIITVIGAGVMGHGIAQRAARAGYDVVLHDLSDAALVEAMEQIWSGPYGLMAAAERGLISEEEAEAARARVRPEAELGVACADADIAIEVIFEDLAIKLRLFRQLDQLCPSRTILASNTSGFPIDALAAATDRPAQVIGWHFSSPVPVMRLSEVVVHPETAVATAETVSAAARRMGCNPEIVNDDPFHYGFVSNRIMFAARAEAEVIVRDGIATADQVDRIMKDAFRWPFGPLEWLDGDSQQHLFPGADPDNPPPSLFAAYPDAARTRRGVSR